MTTAGVTEAMLAAARAKREETVERRLQDICSKEVLSLNEAVLFLIIKARPSDEGVKLAAMMSRDGWFMFGRSMSEDFRGEALAPYFNNAQTAWTDQSKLLIGLLNRRAVDVFTSGSRVEHFLWEWNRIDWHNNSIGSLLNLTVSRLELENAIRFPSTISTHGSPENDLSTEHVVRPALHPRRDRSEIERLYKEHVETVTAANGRSSLEDDIKFMKRRSPAIPREIVRELRNNFAPDKWSKGGRPPKAS